MGRTHGLSLSTTINSQRFERTPTQPRQDLASDDSLWSSSTFSISDQTREQSQLCCDNRSSTRRTRSILGLGLHRGPETSKDDQHSISRGQSRLDKTANTFRRVYRRATHSVSQMTNLPILESLATKDRPRSRATDLLRRATSFRGRPLSSRGYDEKSAWTDSGIQVSPPLLTLAELATRSRHAVGGDAARAAAAAQNQLRSISQYREVKLEKGGDLDAESGIGIEASGIDAATRSLEPYKSNLVRTDPIEYFPNEIIVQILSDLNYSDLIQAELVSRTWYRAAASRAVWKRTFFTEYPKVTGDTYFLKPFSGGRGHGKILGDQDWKRMLAVRKALSSNWSAGSASGRYMLGHTDSVYCVQFDENKIISGSRDRSVKVWDIKSGLCIKTISPSVSDATSQAEEIDLHSSALEDGGRALWPATVPRSQTLPIPASSDIAAPRGSSSMVHQASILCLDFDSDILVTGSSDRTCIVWNVRNNYTPIKRLTHHAGAVLDVCFDSQHIVSCSKDTTICIWDRETSTTLRRLSGHKGPVNAVQMRGNLIVSTSGDALIKLWNLESGRCIREFAGHERGLACVQFSEDSRLILSGGNDHIIRVWDANTGECIRELSGHNRLVRSLHLDTANQRVISGSYDHTVKVFDLSTGHLISDLQNWTDTWVLSSKADYRRMICTSQDGKILLLDYGHDLPDCHILES